MTTSVLPETSTMLSVFGGEGMLKTLARILVVVALAVPSASPVPVVPGEISCDRGVDMPRVQALVKRTVPALQKDPATVIRQINQGDKQWKDGDYYMVVGQGTKIVAHGYIPAAVGQDFGVYPWFRALRQVAMEKGSGCVGYQAFNPAKNGQLEDKVSFTMKVNDTLFALSGTYLIRK